MPVAEAEQIALAPTVEELRARLFDGLAPVPVFAEAVDRSQRQVLVWISQGLPIVRIGKTPWVNVDPARDWLRNRNWKPSGPPPSRVSQSIAA